MLTATRLRWKITGPLAIQDHNGAEHLLTNTTPAMVKRLAGSALKAMLERRLADRCAHREPLFAGRRACLDLVAAAVKHDKTLSAYQKGL